jgi:hypothetical protein
VADPGDRSKSRQAKIGDLGVRRTRRNSRRLGVGGVEGQVAGQVGEKGGGIQIALIGGPQLEWQRAILPR